jgi:hypothetical protein
VADQPDVADDPEIDRRRHQVRRLRDIWLVSHEETNKGARIRTVIDYVRDQFRHDEREWFSTTPRSRSMAAA